MVRCPLTNSPMNPLHIRVIVLFLAFGLPACRHAPVADTFGAAIPRHSRDFNDTGHPVVMASDGSIFICDEFTGKYRFQDLQKGMYYTGEATVFEAGKLTRTMKLREGVDSSMVIIIAPANDTPSEVRLIDEDHRPAAVRP